MEISKDKIAGLPMFFIIGRPRSGTTLIRTLFDAHPEVNIPIECAYISDLRKHYEKITTWDKKILMEFYNDLIVQFRFNNWHADNEKVKAALLQCEGENPFSTICKVVHSSYPSLFKKSEFKLLGDKNPIYSIYTKKLIKIFPKAKFIFIYKDYRDNFVSMKKAKFGLPVVPIQVYQWKYFYRKVLKHSNANPENFLFVKYEELVNNPEIHVKMIFDFVGLPYQSSVLDFHKKKDEFIDTYGLAAEGKHKSLMNPINNSRVGIWKNMLTKKQIHMADMTAGTLADQLGYERVYKKFNLAIWLQITPLILYARYINFLGFVTDLLPYRTRIRVKQSDSILFKIYMKLFSKKDQG